MALKENVIAELVKYKNTGVLLQLSLGFLTCISEVGKSFVRHSKQIIEHTERGYRKKTVSRASWQ